MDEIRSRLYKNPIDKKTHLPYYVPCVVKNRDYLIAYISGIKTSIESLLELDEDFSGIQISSDFDSLRWNDVLPDGRRVRDLTDIEKKRMEDEVEQRQKEVHPDNNVVQASSFFSITCSNCGNYYAFKSPTEIPIKNFKCGLCDRVLIHYTKKDDWYFVPDQPIR